MARAFNLPLIWGTDASLEGRSLSVARDAAVPAIYAEYLGGGVFSPFALGFGIAPVLWNTTLYWEGERASVRLSLNHTDGFPQRARGNNEGGLNYAQYFGVDREQLDLSAGYVFDWLPTKPQLTFNVINITDEPIENYLEFQNVPGEIYNPGRTFLIGIRGSF